MGKYFVEEGKSITSHRGVLTWESGAVKPEDVSVKGASKEDAEANIARLADLGLLIEADEDPYEKHIKRAQKLEDDRVSKASARAKRAKAQKAAEKADEGAAVEGATNPSEDAEQNVAGGARRKGTK